MGGGAVAEWSKALLQSGEKIQQNERFRVHPPVRAPFKKFGALQHSQLG